MKRAALGLALSSVVLAGCDGVFGIHVLDDGVSNGGDDGLAAGGDASDSVGNPSNNAGTNGGRAGPRMIGGDSSAGGSTTPPNGDPDAEAPDAGMIASVDGEVDAYGMDSATPGNDANGGDSTTGDPLDGSTADAQAAQDAADGANTNDATNAPDNTASADTGTDTTRDDAEPDTATTVTDSATTSPDASVDQQAPRVDASDDEGAAADSPTADGGCEGASCGGTCVIPGGTNLLTNGGFDTGVAGWTVFDPKIVLTESALDATGCSTSGSVLATNQDPNGLNSGFYQCVPVTAGVTYNAGVMILTPSGGAQGQTFLQVAWFPTANCAGSSLTLAGQVESSGNFDAWEPLTLTGLLAPSGTGSAYVYGQIIKNFPNTLPYQTYYDMFYLSPAPGGF